MKQVTYLSNRLYSFVVKEYCAKGNFVAEKLQGGNCKSSLGKESIVSSLESLVRKILRELFLY